MMVKDTKLQMWRRLLFPLVFAALSVQAQGGMGKMPQAELGTSAAFAADGTLFAVTKQGGHVVLYRSRDEGQSWSSPTLVNASPEAVSADSENRPKLVVAPNGAVLVSWTQPLGKPYSGAVRLARSDDGGASFALPLTVHRDRAAITHRFETPIAGRDGHITVAWIDKRDLEAAKDSGKRYRGAAIYAAVSTDGGRSFLPERRVADHSCECCRIAAALDSDGAPLLLWRHVFAPNERDHALARLAPDGTATDVARATFDHWRVDGCPHHGPALAVGADGTRHAVWFNMRGDEGRVQYGRLMPGRVEGQRKVGGARAAHADIAVTGPHVAIAWKEFDGERTVLHAELSNDSGQSFRSRALAHAAGASDQPRLLRRDDALFVFWRTEREGMRVFPLR